MTARSIAKTIGQRAVAGLMQETLREEEQTGNLLLQIAERLQREMKEMGGEEEEDAPRSSRGRKQSGPAATASRANRSSSKGANRASGGATVTTDHEEIRQWAEERGATPACVRGTGGKGDTGMLRLDFPGYSGGKSLQKISWDEWFEKFDEEGLALLHRDDNFNKLIAREGSSRGVKKTGRKKSASRAR
jgi:hypothetical protein